jgi:phage FluMu gp28-like protein
MRMWPHLTKRDIKIALIVASILWLIGWVIMPKPKVYKPTPAELDWLATDSGYAEGHMSLGSNPLIFDKWQRTVVDDESKFIIGQKSRQTGWSFGVCSAKALSKSQLIDRKLSVFTSRNLDDAKEKIRYARELYDSIPRSRKFKLITDNKTTLEFSNGSRIMTMFLPRGPGPADVYIDEMAYMARAREIYRGAMGMITRGGQLIAGSTVVSKSGLFYEIMSNESGAFGDFKRYSIYWWESTALCKDVLRASLEAPSMPTNERVLKFGTSQLIAIFRNTYLEDFQQEYELRFIDDEQSFYPLDLILKCIPLIESGDDIGQPAIELYETYEALYANVKGILTLGYDVGRRQNPSVLAIVEYLNGRYHLRMLKRMHKMDFPTQEFEIGEALRILPISRACIDETGLGMQLAENMGRAYPHIVVPVNFAGTVETKAVEVKAEEIGKKDKKAKVSVKERLFVDVKIEMERGNLHLPHDRELIKQFLSVHRGTLAGGNITFTVEKEAKHHADDVVAIALAIFKDKAPAVYNPVMPVFPRYRT